MQLAIVHSLKPIAHAQDGGQIKRASPADTKAAGEARASYVFAAGRRDGGTTAPWGQASRHLPQRMQSGLLGVSYTGISMGQARRQAPQPVHLLRSTR